MSGSDRPFVTEGKTAAWVIGILGTLAVMALMVGALVRATRPEDLTAARALERAQFLAETRQAESSALGVYSWRDKDKGLVNLPVQRAVELVVREWQDPTQARANMISLVEAATAPPPEPENPYE